MDEKGELPRPLEFRLLPWQHAIWERMQRLRQAGRLPHALLFAGPAGVGKWEFAQALAWSLFCGAPDPQGMPCGHCQGCNLFRAQTHPDFRRIVPEEAGKQIRIDAIRAYTEQAGLAAQAGGFKVTLVAPAEAMNTASANSLLKTLEEPVRWTLIILLSGQPGNLPATIRSRCQRVDFGAPPRGQALDWLSGQLKQGDPGLLLDLAAGAPLRALAIAQRGRLVERQKALEEFCGVAERRADPLAVAARWATQDAAELLEWSCGWVVDMVRLRQTQPNTAPTLANPDQRERLAVLAAGIPPRALFTLLDRVYDSIRGLAGSLNTQLMFEELLLIAAESGRTNPER